jgi:hypothetical protein
MSRFVDARQQFGENDEPRRSHYSRLFETASQTIGCEPVSAVCSGVVSTSGVLGADVADDRLVATTYSATSSTLSQT